MQISVHPDRKSTKRGIIQQKTQKNAVVVKSVLDSNCKCLRDTAMRENFIYATKSPKKISWNEKTSLRNTVKNLIH